MLIMLALHNDVSGTAISIQHHPMGLSSSDDDDTVAGQTTSNDAMNQNACYPSTHMDLNKYCKWLLLNYDSPDNVEAHTKPSDKNDGLFRNIAQEK